MTGSDSGQQRRRTKPNSPNFRQSSPNSATPDKPMAEEQFREGFKPDSERIEELEAENALLRAQLALALPMAQEFAKTQFVAYFHARVPDLLSVEQTECSGGRKVRITLKHESGITFFREILRNPETWDAECADLALAAKEWFAARTGRMNGDIDLGRLPRLTGAHN